MQGMPFIYPKSVKIFRGASPSDHRTNVSSLFNNVTYFVPDIEKARGNMRRREKNDGKGGRLALYAMARARVAQRAVKVGR